MAKPIFEILSDDECTDLLRQVPVGRTAINVDALPVLPVNFAVVDGTIVFRTPHGTKLAAATAGAVVAFEVDSYETDGRTAWSVMVQGMASEVTDPAGLQKIEESSVEAWALDGAADHVVRIQLNQVSGRRFTR
jgi:uncharacterized protein